MKPNPPNKYTAFSFLICFRIIEELSSIYFLLKKDHQTTERNLWKLRVPSPVRGSHPTPAGNKTLRVRPEEGTKDLSRTAETVSSTACIGATQDIVESKRVGI